MSDNIDNRYDCHEDCQCTHDDETNKCDGNCPGDIPNVRMQHWSMVIKNYYKH